jgi:hypothetical protein
MVTLKEEWTRPQRLLAAVVYRAWYPEPMHDRFRWPTFYYVAHQMRVQYDLDAREVLESFPVLGSVGIGQLYYSAVFFDRLHPTNPKGCVGLTVAGLAHAASPDQDPVRIFLDLLAHAGEQRRMAVVDPHEPQPITITDRTFSRACGAVSPGLSAALYELIDHEPSAATGLDQRHYSPSDGSWTAEVGLPALDYTDSTTLEEYLSHVTRLHPTVPGPVTSSGGDGGTRTFQVDAPGASEIQIGEHNTQIIYYGGSDARHAQGPPATAARGALPPFPLDDPVRAASEPPAIRDLSVPGAGDSDRAGRLFLHGLESLRAFALPPVSRLDLLRRVLDSTGPTPGSVSLIIGEGGTGKSVLLGQLAEHLAERSDASSGDEQGGLAVVLLSCNAVLAAADLTAMGSADAAFAHAARVLDPENGLRLAVRDLAEHFGGVYVLIDTLDVVLREDTADVVSRLLGDLADHAQLFATCREREYQDLLMDPQLEVPRLGSRTGHPALLVPRLGPTDILEWATRYVDTLDRSDAEREQFVVSLQDAVRSAAVREVCAVPLRLAMACDLYGDSGEVPEDLTITSLFDTYWAQRIARDRRGRHTSQGDAQAEAALALASAVLEQSRGRLSLSVARAAVDGGSLHDGFGPLLSEGVVRENGGRYEFFHQAYAEYTIARRLATSGSAEDLTQLRGLLADPHSFLWPVARHLLMQASSDHRYHDLAKAVPTTTPEGTLVRLLAARTRRSPKLLLATARTIQDQNAKLLHSVATTLAGCPPECHDAALTIVVPMIGKADTKHLSELTRTAGELLGRADSVARARHLPQALDLVQRQEKNVSQDIWLSLPANLVEPVCTQEPDRDIRALCHARYAQLGVRAQRALLRAQLDACLRGASDGIDGLATLAPAMLAAGCPAEMPEQEPVELLQRCWSDPNIRASLGWASWRDLLDAGLPHRWDAAQVRVTARLAGDPSIRAELLANVLGDTEMRFPDRWINAAEFVADAHPTEVIETLCGLTGELSRRAVGALAALSNQVANNADRRDRIALIDVLARHQTAHPRRVWGAQIKMAGPEADLQKELLTAFEAVNATTSASGWPSVRTSALDTWLHVASPRFLASAADRFRSLLPESGGKATVARAEFEGCIAAIDTTARGWVARQLRQGVSSTASGTAVVALGRSMEVLSARADPLLVDWIMSMLPSRHVDATRRLCELLADSTITPDNVLRDRADNWPDGLWTAGPAAVSLPYSVLPRLRTAVEAGEDSQLWSALVKLLKRLDAMSPMPGSTARAVLDLFTKPVRAIPKRLADGSDERLRTELASILNRWVDVVGVIGGKHLPAPELEASVLDTLAGWDCQDLGQQARRPVARVLLGLLHRNPAMAARLADDWWPASGPGTKWAIAEALTVYERKTPGHRSVMLARRTDCPPDLAAWIHRRLRE